MNLLLRQLLSLDHCRSGFLVLFCLLPFSIDCGPADLGTATDGAASDRSGMSRTRAEFEDAFGRWKTMLGELCDLELAFHAARSTDREAVAQRYYEKLVEGYTLEDELLTTATRAFVAEPEENEDLKDFLTQIAVLLVKAECYEDGLRVTQLLLDNQVEERGFYDGLAFYRVVPEFAAISGCPEGDGTGGPGYFIAHEFDKPSHRVHFRGSLSTVSKGPFASGSQFHLAFLPPPQLEGQSTVFGRVIRGMEVLAKLQRRGDNLFSSGTRPDRIIVAQVLRKRNHAYKPKTIPDPTAKARQESSEMIKKLLTR